MQLIESSPLHPPVDIRLSNEEARLLLDYCQNPLPVDEMEIIKLKRDLFETLREGLGQTFPQLSPRT